MDSTRQQAERYYGDIIEALQQRRFDEAERRAVEELRRAPLVPQGWVLLGEALMHSGFPGAARQAFDRAWLLDPQAAWKAAVDRHLQRMPSGPPRPDIEELLRYKQVKVAIGIIVRNEERCIARCLTSLRDAADEIVVVDCGSTDRTVDIVSGFAEVKLIRTEWRRDFAALRNAGLAAMTADWVLWVDADEELHPDDISAVREVAGIYDELVLPPVLYIWQVNRVNGRIHHEFSQTRMFPLNRGLKYHGRVHEQVAPAHGDMYSFPTYRKPVRIRLLHDGYEPEIMRSKAKLERNLELLELMVQEEPDNPGWWTYYARESLSAGRLEQALHGLAEAERSAADKPTFARMLDVYMLTIRIYASQSDWTKVQEVSGKALSLHPDFPDALYYSAVAKLKLGYALYREAELQLREAKTSFGSYRGTVSPDRQIADWKADASLADIARAVGRFGEAAALYTQLSERYPQASELSKPLELLEEQRALLDRVRPQRKRPNRS